MASDSLLIVHREYFTSVENLSPHHIQKSFAL